MAEKKKINWLLILQGWAMLWVVIGHAFIGKAGARPVYVDWLFNFAYSFHMPLFMLVSGWLFYLTRLKDKLTSGGYNWTYWKIVKDKAVRLLVPGFVFSLVAFAVKTLFPDEVTRQAGLGLQDIIHQYLYPNDNPMRELWFIATLFWLFLLTPLWRFVLKTSWTMWLTMPILLILHFWHPNTEFLCLGRVFEYAIWFYLGLVISKTDMANTLLNRNAWVTLIVGIVLYVTGVYTNGFITTIGGITLSFGLALLLDKYLPKTFESFRDYTYQIFLMGIFAQMFIKILYRHVQMPYLFAYILCILVGLYVPVFVSKIIERINCPPLSLCVGLKTK